MVSSSDVGNSESAIWHNFAEMELGYYMTEIDCRILNGVLSTTLKNHRKVKLQDKTAAICASNSLMECFDLSIAFKGFFC
jgi:hypothetical protein